MQKAVYLTMGKTPLLERSKLDEHFNLHQFTEIWEAILFMIDTPKINLFLFDLGREYELNKKILATLHELNPILTVMGLVGYDSKIDTEQYIADNPNFKILEPTEDLVEIYNQIKIQQRKHYRTHWPLSAKIITGAKEENFLDCALMVISAGGCYIKMNNPDQYPKGKKITMEVHFHEFTFLAHATVIDQFPSGQGHLPPGFSVKFKEVTEKTKEYLEKIIHSKILIDLMDVFKDS